MNIKQAKNEIKNTVQAYLLKDEADNYLVPAVHQRPLLLIGAPGIGKTQIMEQIARECHVGLVSYTITHHTRQSAVGLPMIVNEVYEGVNYSVTEYTMSEIISSIYRMMKETGLKEGILFIDEINCVSETLAPTMLQFLQCKTFGNQKVPEGWIIVAAGNPPEYNKSVRDFDMVTLDRVRYMTIEADYNVWKEYARAKNINAAILSYLELKPNNFYKVGADVDGPTFVTARGWEDLSNLINLYKKLGIKITEEVVKEYIHDDEVAEDAAAYFELFWRYEDDYAISAILAGQAPTDVFARLFDASFDERVSVVNLILRGITNHLTTYGLEKLRTDYWYSFLAGFRSRVASAVDGHEGYFTLFNEFVERYTEELKSGLMDETEKKEKGILLEKIRVTGEGIDKNMDPGTAFDVARGNFDVQRKRLESEIVTTKSIIENAFAFMEDAFHSGQEMVIFVTELSISPNAALFLSEHFVEKYDKYKNSLLIGTRKAELLDALEH